jgi:hypothetical protein
VLAAFAAIFGTRHTDATEHQDGLILAIAMESVVKLLAFTLIGLSVVLMMFDGPWDLLQRRYRKRQVMAALTHETPPLRWVLFIGAFGIRHHPAAAPVPCHRGGEPDPRRVAARGMAAAALSVAINIFVLPVAIAGVLQFGSGGGSDLFVLALPMANDMPMVTLITFIGGFSAATAMVIVASVAVAIMISNDIIVPVVLRRRNRRGQSGDFSGLILLIRRTAIVGNPAARLCLLPRGRYQCRPGLDRAVVLRGHRPARPGFLRRAFLAAGECARRHCRPLERHCDLGLYADGAEPRWPGQQPCGGRHPRLRHPGAQTFPDRAPIRCSMRWCLSLLVNCLFYVVGSLSRRPKSIERIQSAVFIPESRG